MDSESRMLQAYYYYHTEQAWAWQNYLGYNLWYISAGSVRWLQELLILRVQQGSTCSVSILVLHSRVVTLRIIFNPCYRTQGCQRECLCVDSAMNQLERNGGWLRELVGLRVRWMGGL
jgi:hypothetical protein